MRYKLVGRTGPRVSELCLGAMIFGGQRGRGAPPPLNTRPGDPNAGGTFELIDTHRP